MESKFKPFLVSSDKINSVPIEQGQFIVTTDTKQTHVDIDNENRITLGLKNLVDGAASHSLYTPYENQDDFTIGENSILLGQNNHSEGTNNFISGNDNFAIGNNLKILGNQNFYYYYEPYEQTAISSIIGDNNIIGGNCLCLGRKNFYQGSLINQTFQIGEDNILYWYSPKYSSFSKNDEVFLIADEKVEKCIIIESKWNTESTNKFEIKLNIDAVGKYGTRQVKIISLKTFQTLNSICLGYDNTLGNNSITIGENCNVPYNSITLGTYNTISENGSFGTNISIGEENTSNYGIIIGSKNHTIQKSSEQSDIILGIKNTADNKNTNSGKRNIIIGNNNSFLKNSNNIVIGDNNQNTNFHFNDSLKITIGDDNKIFNYIIPLEIGMISDSDRYTDEISDSKKIYKISLWLQNSYIDNEKYNYDYGLRKKLQQYATETSTSQTRELERVSFFHYSGFFSNKNYFEQEKINYQDEYTIVGVVQNSYEEFYIYLQQCNYYLQDDFLSFLERSPIILFIPYKETGYTNYSSFFTVGYDNLLRDTNSLETNINFLCGHKNIIYDYPSFTWGQKNQIGATKSVILGEENSTAQGENDNFEKEYKFLFGDHLVGKRGFITGKANNFSNKIDSLFVIGNGNFLEYGTSYRSNAFRVDYTGNVYCSGNYNTSGADYAEMFEWEDGNKNNEDRRGLFVSLTEDKIHISNSNENPIGVVSSSTAAIIGNNFSESWKDMYLRDIFGEIIEEYDEETKTYKPKINPEYNSEKQYIPRSERKEWGCVGFLGQLIVIDDGTCKVNGYCTNTDNGIATVSDEGYLVIKRLDDSHIVILANFLTNK